MFYAIVNGIPYFITGYCWYIENLLCIICGLQCFAFPIYISWCPEIWVIELSSENIFFYPPLKHLSEKAMAPHSSALAWKIPCMEEPGRLQSMGSLRVGHDWVTSLSLFTFMHWRRKWQPTPVFLPRESHGQRSLVGCRLWGHTESDTTEAT